MNRNRRIVFAVLLALLAVGTVLMVFAAGGAKWKITQQNFGQGSLGEFS